MDSPSICLVGTGPMAIAYSKVLLSLQKDFFTVGRGISSCHAFTIATNLPVISGGIDLYLSQHSPPDYAIVAVDVPNLTACLKSLLLSGCKNILLEKPGSLSTDTLACLEKLSVSLGVSVWIAYNRRFLPSVIELTRRVSTEGGPMSAFFDFSEWSHKIESLNHSTTTLNYWLLSNSSHVLDLAFYLIGLPEHEQFMAYRSGSLPWHPISSRFAGAGVSSRSVLFSYLSDWQAPGSWSISLSTTQHKYSLRPLERLFCQEHNSLTSTEIALDNDLDRGFKPGLYLQTLAFLDHDHERLCSISHQLAALRVYKQIAGYK